MRIQIGLLAALALCLAQPTRAQPVSWTSDADGDWNDPARWDAGVPGPADDVVIDRPAADPTVTHSGGASSVASLTSQEDLVVSGGSLVTGAFTAGSAVNLSVQGSGVSFSAGGPTSFDGASLSSSGGGSIDLSAATSYASAGGRTFRATGASSAIDLSGISLLTGSTVFRQELLVDAVSGGLVDLSGVTSLSDSSVIFRARGAGSVVDLSSLATFVDSGGSLDDSAIEATGGGTVLLPGAQPLSIDGYTLRKAGASSTFDTSGLTSLTRSTVDVSGLGASLDLSSLASLDGNTFLVSDGASLALPGSSYAAGAGNRTLRASGSDGGTPSTLDASSLTTLSGATAANAELRLEALAGGLLDLSGVSTLVDSSIVVRANGPGSVVDLSSLATFADTGTSLDISSIEASGGGSVLLPGGQPLAVDGYTLRKIGASSTFDTSGLTSLTRSTVDVSGLGATFDLSSLTSFDGNSLLASGGASLTIHGSSYAAGAGNRTLRASGSDSGTPSTLDASSLTTLSGATAGNAELRLEALAGGLLDLSGVTTLADSSISVRANGAGSAVDLSSLATFADTGTSLDISSIEASGGGSVLLPGAQPIAIDGYTLRIDGATSTLDSSQVTSLTNSTATAVGPGATFDFGSLASFDTNSFVAQGGAELVLSTTQYAAGTFNRSLRASGVSGPTASRLDASMLTSLSGATGGNADLSVEAQAGGVVDLSSLTSITGGAVDVSAAGAGSRVDLSALTSFVDTNAATSSSSIQASDGGLVELAAGASELSGVRLHASSTGTIRGGTVSLLAGSRAVGRGSLEFDLLVVDGGALAPGFGADNPASILLEGDYEQSADGALEIDLAGVLAEQYDRVEVLGSATLAGEIRVDLLRPTPGGSFFDPQVGDHFDVFAAAQILDAGIEVVAPLIDGRAWATQIVSDGGTDVLRLLVTVPEPATALLLGLGLAGLVVRRRA